VSTKDERDGRPDAALVAAARDGEAEAFAQLVHRYRRAAYSVALGVLGRHEDAEDAAQEAFLVALERLDECRDTERFAGWFMTIVRTRSLNLVRRESLRVGEPLPLQIGSEEPGPHEAAEKSELRRRLSAALVQLTEVQRQVVLLHDMEGWKHREIAERLEMPSGTVRSHLHFARRRLRELLAPASEPDRKMPDSKVTDTKTSDTPDPEERTG
jgi:RNA polymerase sigma-70 factor, ECF subfamily